MHGLRPRHREGSHLLSRSSPRDGERHEGPGPQPAILVVCGLTGTGKSPLAVAVSERLGGEIVSCDALQVYRGLDAGTAKPTREQRRDVPHWLIDNADPRRNYSLADYVKEADDAIAAIHDRGRVPIVVGGTGMYLRGLLKGVVAAPPRDEALRQRLRAQVARFGSPRVHRFLAALDAVSAARVAPEDAQRVVRALELALSSGQTWSTRLARTGTWLDAAERYRALKFGLDLDREVLAERLAARVDAFFAADLPGEIDRLVASGVPVTANAFKGIGYREVLAAKLERRDPGETKGAIVVATRQYAKRQRTWFRKEPGLVWLDAAVGRDALASAIVLAWKAARTEGGASSAC